MQETFLHDLLYINKNIHYCIPNIGETNTIASKFTVLSYHLRHIFKIFLFLFL